MQSRCCGHNGLKQNLYKNDEFVSGVVVLVLRLARLLLDREVAGSSPADDLKATLGQNIASLVNHYGSK